MGGKKRGSVRQRKRADEVAKELVLNTTSAGQVVEGRADEELFLIDNEGNKHLGRQIRNEAQKRQKKREGLPEQLGRKVKKLLETHDGDAAKITAMAMEGRKNLDVKELRRRRRIATKRTNFDLWEESGQKGGALESSNINTATLSNKQQRSREHAKKTARPTVAVELALPGQSYKPDLEHHQDAIGEALAIEIQRNEAREYNSTPLSSAAPTNDDDDNNNDSDSDSDSDEDDNDTTATSILDPTKKRFEKLTNAQRNKQKRVREEQIQAKERKRQRQMLHTFTEVKKISKEILVHEKERLERRTMVEQLKQEEQAKPLGTNVYHKSAKRDPIRVASLPVALTEELNRNVNGDEDGNGSKYSLRTIKPKGSLLRERLDSMADRKMAYRKKFNKKKITQGKRRKPGKHNMDIHF